MLALLRIYQVKDLKDEAAWNFITETFNQATNQTWTVVELLKFSELDNYGVTLEEIKSRTMKASIKANTFYDKAEEMKKKRLEVEAQVEAIQMQNKRLEASMKIE